MPSIPTTMKLLVEDKINASQGEMPISGLDYRYGDVVVPGAQSKLAIIFSYLQETPTARL